MDFTLSHEQRILFETVRGFNDAELAPLEQEVEDNGLSPETARKVVLCGTFDAKGGRLAAGDGRLTIHAHDAVRKLVGDVDQITFSGPRARMQEQRVLYVTERAVFRLGAEGPVLTEIAPGVDLHQDVLGRMGFAPEIAPGIGADPATIAAHHFEGGQT